ncbi:MAG: SDR family oxidoreductase [Phenylobacterium sp.]|uniref:SDR family oxidoreductase n=1 Tax=Phenylobacterium sp. TaxID=1871053 RepID=UPI00391CF07C
MRVLLIGATGMIGAHVLARLQAEGFELRATARSPRPPSLPSEVEWVRLDLRQATTEAAWRPLLDGVDAVVNCAGVFQDGLADSVAAVHAQAPAALFAASEAAGVRRVIQISAVGVDRDGLSPFSATKRTGDDALMASALEWVVLRPSVVLGRSAYGGGALMRALAALPVAFVPPDGGLLQVVQLDELVETIVFFLAPGAPVRVALEIAGPKQLSFAEVVAAYRRWLGWKPARSIAAPRAFMALGYRLGDAVSLLGWRSPIRTTARLELTRGAVGDPSEWTRLTGIQPRALETALAATPATVQERWFAGLYLLKALVFAVLPIFWIGTGVISLGPGFGHGVELMREGGAGPLSGPSVIAGALADIAIGLGIAFRRTSRPALYAALGLSIFYMVAGAAILPRLWADPLGPMWKIWPIMALHLVALAMRSDR